MTYIRFVGGTYHYDVDASKLTAEQLAEVTAIHEAGDSHRAQAMAQGYEHAAILAELNAADAAEPKRDRRFLARNRPSPARRSRP
jgi:hypothetical protein